MCPADGMRASDSDESLVIEDAPVAAIGDVLATVVGGIAFGIVETVKDIDMGAEQGLGLGVDRFEGVAGDEHAHHAVDVSECVDGLERGNMIWVGDGEGGWKSGMELKDGCGSHSWAGDRGRAAESTARVADDGQAVRGVAGEEVSLGPGLVVELSEGVGGVIAVGLKRTNERVAIVRASDGQFGPRCAESHRERHGGNVSWSLGTAPARERC